MRTGPDAPNPAVAEIQGLYGAFSFPEKLLQKIWLRGDFDRSAALTSDGRRLRVLHPGKWNLLGGPDFQGARLRLGEGPEITGDVEVHLHAADWDAHGHARDRTYDRVVLHVVLFPPDERRTTRGADGREIPVLTLLPLLHHALEEFAAEDAVENLANRALARLPDELGILPPPELAAILHRHAEARWRQKVHFARLRVQRLGWEAACHHAALEVLGYRFNRAPMLRVAGQWSRVQWVRGGMGADKAFAAEAGGWSLQGVRPANHPRTRLRQYAAWSQARPDWPSDLVTLAAELPPIAVAAATRAVRRTHRFAVLRTRIADRICADALGGTRLDSLVGDGLLPLLAAHTGRGLHGLWYHWFAGDLPALLMTGLRGLGVFDGRGQPACHGGAQGLLGWLLERESRN
ncbi:MAG: DUF2851 family protein [Verrucomicrobia bacterium]|nr:DUF2851 family protein [Verrucomicrobiota bacterium]